MGWIPQGRSWRRWVLVVAAVCTGPGLSIAEASRIRHEFARPEQSPVSPLPFASFLEAGPALWSHATPRLPDHPIPLRLNADGTPMASLFLDYLLYRRALNPARFDAHHRHIAGLLALVPPPPAPFTAPPTILPVPQIVAPPAPTPPTTQTVPEPSSALIALAMLAAGAVGRRWGRSPFSGRDASA